MTNLYATNPSRGNYKTPRSPTPTCPGPTQSHPSACLSLPASFLSTSEKNPHSSDQTHFSKTVSN